MKVLVDAFGGDNAPLEIIKGCHLCLQEYEGLTIGLVGNQSIIEKVAKENNIPLDGLVIHDAPGVKLTAKGMPSYPPVTAVPSLWVLPLLSSVSRVSAVRLFHRLCRHQKAPLCSLTAALMWKCVPICSSNSVSWVLFIWKTSCMWQMYSDIWTFRKMS